MAVVGDDSPLIDLQAEDEEGDRCVTRRTGLEEWCRNSDAAGRINLSTRIKRWNRSCWLNGEWLDQFVFPQDAKGAVKLRLHEIEPQRLTTPISAMGDGNVVLGIRRGDYRQPLAYWISRSTTSYGDVNGSTHRTSCMAGTRGDGRTWSGAAVGALGPDRIANGSRPTRFDLQVMDAARACR